MSANLLHLGIVLGIGAAAPIGPVNVEIVRRTLCGGFAAGFALGCGAVSVDVFYAILASQGLKRVFDYRGLAMTVGLLGAGVLAYLGTVCLVGAWRARRRDALSASLDALPPVSSRNAYLAGLLLTLLNPLTLAFWFIAVPAAVGPITEEPGRDLPMICAGVFAGTIGWVVVFTGVIALAGRWRRRSWTTVADGIGGLTLLAFAGLALWRLARSFL